MNERRVGRAGFSLVEVLVVIGIVALLIGLLVPVLGRSREQAKQVECLAKLHAIGQAAQAHVNDHGGYLPLAGWHWNTDGPCTEVGLDDRGGKKYDYYADAGVRRPLPITAALGGYMGVSVRTSDRAGLEADLKSDGLKRLFRCPSQAEEAWGWTERGDDQGKWEAPSESSSYVFNEAVLGRRDGAKVKTCPQGLLTKVNRAGEVFFAMDGRPRDRAYDRCFLAFEFGKGESVYDFDQHCRNSTILGKEMLDYWRHDGRANVLFLDWHASAVPMSPAGLRTVGVSNGIDP